MIELYRIKNNGEINEVKKFPFSDEPKELEDFIMKNEGILGNVILLNRQIKIPDGKRIDLWGLDVLEIKPVIIELKNVPTGIEVIPQILPYYNFVKSNPDTLKFKAVSDEKFQEKLNKSKDGIIRFPKVFERLCATFCITKKDCWEILLTFRDINLVEIVPHQGIRVKINR